MNEAFQPEYILSVVGFSDIQHFISRYCPTPKYLSTRYYGHSLLRVMERNICGIALS